jgi:hypothetical protein
MLRGIRARKAKIDDVRGQKGAHGGGIELLPVVGLQSNER